MEYPLDSKGLKCMICGKDIWYDLIDKETLYYENKSIEFPKPPRKGKVCYDKSFIPEGRVVYSTTLRLMRSLQNLRT